MVSNELIRIISGLSFCYLQKHPGYHPEGKDRCVAKAAATAGH